MHIRKIFGIVITMLLVSPMAARASFLVVNAVGTVRSDYDTANVFGFGISPPLSGQNPSTTGTAVGQSVSMTFILDLNNIAPDLCANGACSNPGFRAHYATDTVPDTNWISTTAMIGDNVVPEFAPHGGNVGKTGGIEPSLGSTSSATEIWTQYNGMPYNELFIASQRVEQSVIDIAPGTYSYVAASQTSAFRIDSLTTSFLSGLSVNQEFSWTSSMDDGASTAFIARDAIFGGCVNYFCQSEKVASAFAYIRLDSVTGKVVSAVPEPSSLVLFGISLAALGLINRRKVWPIQRYRGAPVPV